MVVDFALVSYKWFVLKGIFKVLKTLFILAYREVGKALFVEY